MKTVNIFLSTYNGEKFIKEQLDSVLNQNTDNKYTFKVFVRDDGSSDNTVNILKEYESKNLITLFIGENWGWSKSFSWLINTMPHADYYSYCDQDDVWLPNKVLNAIKTLSEEDDNIPLIYHTAVKVVDVNLKLLVEKSHTLLDENSETLFQDSILQSMINGCTSVFNNKLRELFCKIPYDQIRACDMMLNNIACGTGKSIFSRDAQILYRQHPKQCFGYVNGSIKILFRTLKAFFHNELKSIRFYDNIILKHYIYDYLNDENKKFVDLLYNYKKSKNDKRKLKKYINKNIKNKSIRVYSKLLLFLGKI